MNMAIREDVARRFRTIWISDIHLGARGIYVPGNHDDALRDYVPIRLGGVLLEALASGVPVAAYPVHGPIDVVNGHRIGVLDEDLGCAVRKALKISRIACRDFALGFTWRACAEQFLGNLPPIARGD